MEFYLRKGNWNCGSESSSLSHSDKRYGWEDEVNSQGELFYVQHYPFPADVNEPCNQSVLPADDSNDKDSPGIFGRLMRRRSSRRSFKRKDNSKLDSNLPGSSSVADQLPLPEVLEKGAEDIETVNIYMKIDFSNIKAIGRRATAVETFLGLKIMFYDTKIIILDLIPNGPAFYLQTAFQKGDCLHSINGILVTSENIEQYLRNISFSKEIKEVVLTVHRVKSSKKKVEVPKTQLSPEQEDCELEGFGVLFANIGTRGGSNDSSISADDIIFSYSTEGNMLSSIRGTFLTLLHLLPSLGAGQPISTSVISNGLLVHIIYTRKEDDVMFLALPDSRISLKECYWINANVVRCLEFTFQTVSRCFRNERNANSLQKFFHALFKRLYNRKKNLGEFFCEFESLLPAAHRLVLPHHIYVQIDDALNELEANDIEIYEDQRLYSIIGSCYFYKGYKVCSHLAKEDLVDVMSLCKQSDILGLMRAGVSELVFWKEAYPSSVGRGLGPHAAAPYSLLPASWFLLIVAKDQNFLFVLLESANHTVRTLQKSGPDVAYIEEALATLKHIIKIGIPGVANKLLKTKDAPKPATNYSPVSVENNLHTSYSETTLNKQHSLSYRSLDISHLPRSRSNINLVSTSSGFCNDSLSSDDCPPVIGRRAERELAMETVSRASDVSDDSDWNKDYKSYAKGHSHDLEGTEVNVQLKWQNW
ncbi:protein inturned isoform X2 [Halyomorpha halys]|uniref:protein inturned isoform X2 n=1 Tax=Halyomorpha halys TaxID=286706 RepID=UPI0006D4E858|nr:protein inturned isoform X2 [Halyomorpha halys]